MNHRHLLPDEIDLLLDDEVGFGVAPLKEHVSQCADCRAQVEELRAVMGELEDLPYFAPSYNFQDRVMAQVPVFVPWHTAARDTIREWLPQSRPALVTVGAVAASVVTLLTIATLWIVTRTDTLALAASLAADRASSLVGNLGRELVTLMFGEQVSATIRDAGTIGAVIALLVISAAMFAAVAGLRAMAAVSSRRRG